MIIMLDRSSMMYIFFDEQGLPPMFGRRGFRTQEVESCPLLLQKR